MMFASKGGFPKTIAYLYSIGGDLRARNKAGMTSAHFAVQSDNVDCLVALHDLFHDYIQKALVRMDELDQIALSGGGGGVSDHDSLAEDDNSSKASAKSGAASQVFVSEEDMLNEILVAPQSSVLDMPALNGSRAIHLCGDFGSLKCLQYLISLGVDVNSEDSIGETPMHKAARKNFFEVYRMMKAAGGKEYAENSMRETPHQLLHDETFY